MTLCPNDVAVYDEHMLVGRDFGYDFRAWGLGAPVEPVTLDQCRSELGLSREACQELLQRTEAQPEAYYTLAKTAILGYGTHQCAALLQGAGLPLIAGEPLCGAALGAIWNGLLEQLPRVGAPTFYPIAPSGSTKPNMWWRWAPTPDDLRPGEHWRKTHKGNKAALNVAVYYPDDGPAQIRYVPCSRMPPAGSHLWAPSKSPTGKPPCRDLDGTWRKPGTQKTPRQTTHQALYVLPGHYGEREVDGYRFPFSFEEPKGPPKTDYRHPAIREAIRDIRVDIGKRAVEPPGGPAPSPGAGAAAPPSPYPAGSIAAFDPQIQRYRVAVPRFAGLGSLSAPQYAEVALRADKPAGVKLVPIATYQSQTGNQPWYKKWQTYAIAGGILALGGGAYALSRR